MKKYNLINNIAGWCTFAIAAIVYLMTIEPSTSFWDCGEFITTIDKLEVGHPPGAPFFMLTGKFFLLFTSDPSQIAMMVNAMSGIMSALTIFFLFWTITHLAKKLIAPDKEKEMTLGQTILIIGSGLVGALAYTFSDTFWFSAVEAEVYAYSSMFTALVFWLILKWENRADEPGSDKWLVVIAYAMGLSIGVHLLNLLCIPAIVLIYYFRKNKEANLLGTSIAFAVSAILIVALMYGIIPGVTKVGGWFELLFVNSFGFSYNSGAFFYFILLIGIILWGLYETISKNGNLIRAKLALLSAMMLTGITFISDNGILWLLLIIAAAAFIFFYKGIGFRQLNTTLLCLMVILIGYSSFALIPIRSAANTPMDQNSPEDMFALASYLNREQYGDRPLVYGKTFASEVSRTEGGAPVYSSQKDTYAKVVKKSPDQKDEYYVSGKIPSYKYDNSMLFPRMYSDVQRHMSGYEVWGNCKTRDINGKTVQPTFMQNLHFFFSYQINYMYFRYFMWNFSGRQSDVQGAGTVTHGNWITGIGPLDEFFGNGPQDELPPDIAENKGHNTYFALPLILGILGIFFQISQNKRGQEQFLVTFMLFFMTGLAIIIYLNQQPFEPRERDYAYAGSFYAFCIWIGLGVPFIAKLLRKVLSETPASAIAVVACLCIPIQMASQTWDDHDRSGRYTARDFGRNYLAGCEPNSIIFSMGDNDTFPLWYAQEVEGYRTDVRVCNISYLQTDWYVDQMRRQAYESTPLPIDWKTERYSGDRGQAAYILSKKEIQGAVLAQMKKEGLEKWIDRVNWNDHYDTRIFQDTLPADYVLDILKTKDKFVPKNPFIRDNDKLVVIPSNVLSIPIDSAKVNWKDIGTQPANKMVINLGDKDYIYRDGLMELEMINNIAKDNWERPIYWATTIGESPLGLEDQSQLEGIMNRIVPGQVDSTGVNVDKMYDNLMNKYQWGGIENPKVYLDAPSLQMCYSFRSMFSKLISALVAKGDKERAMKALEHCLKVIPPKTVPLKGEGVFLASAYYELGEPQKAQEIIDIILDRSEKSLKWYSRMKNRDMIFSTAEIREYMDVELRVLSLYNNYDKQKFEAMRKKTMDRSVLFMSNGVRFSSMSHPLDNLMQFEMRDYFRSMETDSTKAQYHEARMDTIAKMLHQYDPAILKKYQR